MSLPNCKFISSAMHMCYYHQVPCDLNEVLRITVISHCIATLRVPERLKIWLLILSNKEVNCSRQ